MNRSLAYAVSGAVLAGVAVWVLRHRYDGEPLAADPLDEVDRMMSQAQRKITEIQRNFNEFRHVLTQAAVLEVQAKSGSS